ncbi:N-acetyltransferase [Gordonia desulfuricans]|uniref:N-acetyltransferase n=1 Tax=Gordonia desulfuricans TaxID=89051 RepID=A0A7K3LPP9_9ACTN|nr:N-acetyltransferase [Gordonia desulfuricans]NDK90188.1 N-acetyltransferase [Gordonia desulfuricans]
MDIHPVTVDDLPAVLDVVGRAFADPAHGGEPVEVGLTERLFADAGYLPALALAAWVDRSMVGMVIGTRGHVGDLPAVGVGPLAVSPDRQGHGIGTALMHAELDAAGAAGERVVALLGEPDFYGRFGFGPAAALGIDSPDPAWGRHFQALLLDRSPAPRGVFRYAAPFDDL